MTISEIRAAMVDGWLTPEEGLAAARRVLCADLKRLGITGEVPRV